MAEEAEAKKLGSEEELTEAQMGRSKLVVAEVQRELLVGLLFQQVSVILSKGGVLVRLVVEVGKGLQSRILCIEE